jgi:hypothetical protein
MGGNLLEKGEIVLKIKFYETYFKRPYVFAFCPFKFILSNLID